MGKSPYLQESGFGFGISQAPEATPANIIATAMIITPSKSPCTVGTCTVSVNVTWTNTGETSGTFVPNLIVDTVAIYPAPLPSENLLAGESIAHIFVLHDLTPGTHFICPNPNE